jgi:hypothetical protein
MRVSSGETLDTEQQLALELIRQLEIVTIRNPSLAAYVKYVESLIWLELVKNPFLPTFGMSSVVNVVIGDHCVRNVLRELARCLAIFPNLHTLRLDHTELTVDFWETE